MVSNKIYETKNFLVEMPEKPHISREEGGHIVISPKVGVLDRTRLTPDLAIELMRLTMIAGEAMATVLNRNGIDVGRINYQDNGNWGLLKPEGPTLHIHLYGRAKSAVIQKYGEALSLPKPSSGFYDSFKTLTEEDIAEMRKEIEIILKREKYQNEHWYLR